MNTKNTLILVLILFGLNACTGVNETIYEMNQSGERIECDRQPPSQVQACLDRVNVSFDEYEAKREEALAD